MSKNSSNSITETEKTLRATHSKFFFKKTRKRKLTSSIDLAAIAGKRKRAAENYFRQKISESFKGAFSINIKNSP